MDAPKLGQVLNQGIESLVKERIGTKNEAASPAIKQASEAWEATAIPANITGRELSMGETLALRENIVPFAFNASEILHDYERFERSTPEERKFILKYAAIARDLRRDADIALAEAARRFPHSEFHNRQGEAFYQAYWSALMTKHYGPEIAKEFAEAHEMNLNQPADEREMGFHNCEAGRNIALAQPAASETELAIHVGLNQQQLKTLE
jgi:hypothetical protein